MNMIGAVVGALIIGIIGMFAVAISQGIYAGQNTTGWSSILTTSTSNIPAVTAIVAILAMLLIIAKIATSNTGGLGGV